MKKYARCFPYAVTVYASAKRIGAHGMTEQTARSRTLLLRCWISPTASIEILPNKKSNRIAYAMQPLSVEFDPTQFYTNGRLVSMTNEELAAKIQNGADELLSTLWEQVRLLVFKMANRWALAFSEKNWVEIDDLVNSGYIALSEAVQTYDSEKGTAFTTWFSMYLKTAFLDAYGLRAHKNDPLQNAASLDAPIVDSSGKDITLGDAVADPRGEAALSALDEKIFAEQLHDALDKALSTLPAEQSRILRLYYYEGKTYEEIGALIGTYAQKIQQRVVTGLRRLRRNPRANELLIPFVDFDYYHGVGAKSYSRTGTSIQERYLIAKEKEAHRQKCKMLEGVRLSVESRIGQMTPEEKAALLVKYGFSADI